jgi:hypothetical protein
MKDRGCMRSRLIKFVAVYTACCLLPLLTTVLVDRIFIRFFFWQGGHADEPVMGFLVSIHTLFFFPWTVILAFMTNNPHRWSLEVNFARWIVCTLTWGLVLYFLYRVLAWVEGIVSAKLSKPEQPVETTPAAGTKSSEQRG